MRGIRVGVQGSPGRWILAIVALLIAMAFASCAVFLRGSAASSITDVVDSMLTADIYIKPAGSNPADMLVKPKSEQRFLNTSVTAQVSNMAVSDSTLPIYVGQVVLQQSDGTVISSGITPSFGIGYDSNEVEGGRLIEGVLPSKPQEIALEEATAKRIGLAVGDEAQLTANGSRFDPMVTVTGIVSYNSELGGATVVILNDIVARAVFAPSSMVPLIAVRVSNDMDLATAQERIIDEIDSEVPYDVVLGKDLRQETVNRAMEGFQSYSIALLVLAGLSLIVGGVAIATIFAGSGRTTASQIATAKAWGVTTGQVLGGIVGQAVVIGLVGSIVGVIAGFGLVSVLTTVLASLGLVFTSSLPWLELGVCLGIGIVVAVIAALLGAWRAASVKPVEAVNGIAPAKTGLGIVRVIIGVVLGVAGVAGMVWGLMGTNDNLFIGVGVIVTIIGALLAAPIFTVVLSLLFVLPIRIFSSASARFAKNNIVRTARRAANAASILMVGTMLASAGLVMASSAEESISSRLENDVTADFVLTSSEVNGFVPDQAVSLTRQLPNLQITAIGKAPARMLTSRDKNSGFIDATILFAPPELFSITKATIVDGVATDFHDGVAITKTFATAHGLKIGDSVHLLIGQSTPNETVISVPVVLIIKSQLFQDVMLPTGWLIEPIPGHARSQFMPVSTVFVSQSQGDSANLKAQLDEVLTPFPNIDVQSRDEFVSTPNSWVTLTRIGAYVVTGFAAILMIIVIISILNQAVVERRSELESLWASGASLGQLRRMVSFESVLICAAGAAAGIGGGIGLAYVGTKALTWLGISTFSIPWIWIAGLFVLSILIGLLAGIAPARRAAKVPTLVKAA